jgi:hypothetical protein
MNTPGVRVVPYAGTPCTAGAENKVAVSQPSPLHEHVPGDAGSGCSTPRIRSGWRDAQLRVPADALRTLSSLRADQAAHYGRRPDTGAVAHP